MTEIADVPPHNDQSDSESGSDVNRGGKGIGGGRGGDPGGSTQLKVHRAMLMVNLNVKYLVLQKKKVTGWS